MPTQYRMSSTISSRAAAAPWTALQNDEQGRNQQGLVGCTDQAPHDVESDHGLPAESPPPPVASCRSSKEGRRLVSRPFGVDASGSMLKNLRQGGGKGEDGTLYWITFRVDGWETVAREASRRSTENLAYSGGG